MPDGAALIRPTFLWSVSGFCRPVKARRHPAIMPDGAALIRPTVQWSISGFCRPDKAPAAIRQKCLMALRLSGLRFCDRFRGFVGRIRRQPPSGNAFRFDNKKARQRNACRALFCRPDKALAAIRQDYSRVLITSRHPAEQTPRCNHPSWYRTNRDRLRR